MFTVLKVREGITSSEDPGWYRHPEGTVAWKVARAATSGGAEMHLAVLFLSAFAAATILPMSSEVVLAVATAGNALGAMVNWGLGRYAARWRTRVTGEHDLPARHGTGEKSRRQRPVGEESAMLGTSNPRSSTSSRRPPSATRSNERPLSDQRTVTP